jgi:hypothetical protein
MYQNNAPWAGARGWESSVYYLTLTTNQQALNHACVVYSFPDAYLCQAYLGQFAYPIVTKFGHAQFRECMASLWSGNSESYHTLFHVDPAMVWQTAEMIIAG